MTHSFYRALTVRYTTPSPRLCQSIFFLTGWFFHRSLLLMRYIISPISNLLSRTAPLSEMQYGMMNPQWIPGSFSFPFLSTSDTEIGLEFWACKGNTFFKLEENLSPQMSFFPSVHEGTSVVHCIYNYLIYLGPAEISIPGRPYYLPASSCLLFRLYIFWFLVLGQIPVHEDPSIPQIRPFRIVPQLILYPTILRPELG